MKLNNFIILKKLNKKLYCVEYNGGHYATDWYGYYPCPDQAYSNSPSDCRQPFGGTNAYDRTGNSMSGTDGYFKMFGKK